jgi:hypothetical protein
MRIHHVATLALLMTLLPIGAAWAEDLEDGFMGYQWGSDISKYPNLKQLYSKGGLTFYANPGESYTLEDMTIGDVIYGFYRGKFYAVYVNLDTIEKYDAVERIMKAKYGLPDHKSSAKENLFTFKWKYRDVTIKLKQDQLKGSMKVAFYHEPTSSGLDQERRILEIENTDQFFPLKKEEDIDMAPFLDFWDMR